MTLCLWQLDPPATSVSSGLCLTGVAGTGYKIRKLGPVVHPARHVVQYPALYRTEYLPANTLEGVPAFSRAADRPMGVAWERA